jgi:hypothetical protein
MGHWLPRCHTSVLVAILFVVPCQAAQVQTKSGWRWGMWEIEAYDASGRLKKAPQAAVDEMNGRGHALILLRCQGRYLTLVDGPEDSFWEKAADNETGDRKVVWLRWGDENEPILSEPGQDGWYFDIDVSRGQASVGGRFNSLLRANAFALCPSKEADLAKCRQFSGAKFDQAVSFVCGRR